MDVWQRVMIGNRFRIQSPINTSWTPIVTVLFKDHVQGRCPWTVQFLKLIMCPVVPILLLGIVHTMLVKVNFCMAELDFYIIATQLPEFKSGRRKSLSLKQLRCKFRHNED